MSLRRVILCIRHGWLLSVWLALAACGEREPIEDFIVEVTARPGNMLEPLPPLTPYQSVSYQASMQRSPFMAFADGLLHPEQAPRAEPEQSPDCHQGVAGPESPENQMLPALSLQATFIGSHRGGSAASALILVAGADTQLVTIGQQLEFESGEEAENQLEVIDISAQQLTLRQRLVQAQGCEQVHTTTLQLY
ncbi:pilus assembly protein PilP [Oceanisphaera sp.]|uniref:pilus assembly protein PilP n=1 Tax=Oceanisphaera sp. TaxID=1929979 RepID=UPI003A8F395D